MTEKEKLKQIVKDLHQKGWGYRSISNYLLGYHDYKISHVGVKKWCEKMGLKSHPAKTKKQATNELLKENEKLKREVEELREKVIELESKNECLEDIIKMLKNELYKS